MVKKIKYKISAFSNITYKLEDSEPVPEGWDDYTEEEKELYIDDIVTQVIQNDLDAHAEVVDE